MQTPFFTRENEVHRDTWKNTKDIDTADTKEYIRTSSLSPLSNVFWSY